MSCSKYLNVEMEAKNLTKRSREQKMLNTFCKKYLKVKESDFIIPFICSPDKVNIDSLLQYLRYF